MEIIMGTAMPASSLPTGRTPILFSWGAAPAAFSLLILGINSFLIVFFRKRTRLQAAPFWHLLFQFTGGQLGEVGIEETVQVAVHDAVDLTGCIPRAEDAREPCI